MYVRVLQFICVGVSMYVFVHAFTFVQVHVNTVQVAKDDVGCRSITSAPYSEKTSLLKPG